MSARPLPGAGSGDDGLAHPGLRAALAAYDGSAAGRADVLAQAAIARLFVPIAAASTAEHADPGTGLRAESSAEMALLSLLSASGERAVPAFLDVPGLLEWRSEARPVPVQLADLARAALDDGAVAVLLDPPGVALALAEGELRALADGYLPVPGSPLAFRRTTQQLGPPQGPVDPDLVHAVRAALGPERLVAARLVQGATGLALGVLPADPVGPAELTALADRVSARLGAALPAGGLDLCLVPRTGPGLDVLRPRRGRWRFPLGR